MCGIVGAAARRDIVPVLIEGLRRLEYRGYDSCGLALVDQGTIDLVRTVSRVNDLATKAKETRGVTGLAHTRWATHGAPLTENAHPIVSRGEIAVVHNGIIENHDELRAELRKKGYGFDSQTATAVVAKSDPGTVVGARAGSPLVVGVGNAEHFLASDALALAGTTDRIAYLEEGDVAAIDQAGWRVVDSEGRAVTREVRTVKTSGAAAELGPYRHFMQKEIFEQPRAVADTLESVAGIGPELFGEAARDVLPGV